MSDDESKALAKQTPEELAKAPAFVSPAPAGQVQTRVTQAPTMALGFQFGGPPPALLEKITPEHLTEELKIRKDAQEQQHKLAMAQLAADEKQDEREYTRLNDELKAQNARDGFIFKIVIGLAAAVVIFIGAIVYVGKVDQAIAMAKDLIGYVVAFLGGMGTESKLRQRLERRLRLQDGAPPPKP